MAAHRDRVVGVVVGLMVAIALVAGHGARANGEQCQPLSWAPQPLPGYALDSCDGKAWDQVSLSTTGGDRNVAGKRRTVSYVLKDPSKDEKAMTALTHFVKLAEGAGAKLVSDPSGDFDAVLVRHTGHGDTWYHYSHDGGDDNSTTGYSLTMIEVAPFVQVVKVRDFAGPLDTQHCQDPGWLVKQLPQFQRAGCDNRDFDSVKVDLADGPKVIAGHVHEVNYQLTDPHRDPVARYVRDNYVRALEKLGARLVSDPDDTFNAYLTRKAHGRTLWYLYRHGGGNDASTTSYSLITIQVGGPPPKTCKLEVYGIHFDFDKATLRPDSEPVLEELLALFHSDPRYQAEIGGHTDNKGSSAYNLKLSDRRAAAVKAWLVAHGVSANRLRSRGYGESHPLVPNTSEQNRAKNRRVELKRLDCHEG